MILWLKHGPEIFGSTMGRFTRTARRIYVRDYVAELPGESLRVLPTCPGH